MKVIPHLLLFSVSLLSLSGCDPGNGITSIYDFGLFETTNDFNIESWQPDLVASHPQITLDFYYSEHEGSFDLGDSTLIFSDGATELFKLKCSSVFREEPSGAAGRIATDIVCSDIKMSTLEPLCGVAVPSFLVEQEFNGAVYKTNSVEARVVCQGDPRRLDLLDLQAGPLPEGRPCGWERFLNERYGWDNELLVFLDEYEDGERVTRTAFEYNGDGTILNIITIDIEGFVQNTSSFTYAAGIIQSRRFNSSQRDTTCTYSFSADSSEWTVQCPDSQRTFQWDDGAKTITREIDGKEFTLSYRGELSSPTDFLSAHPVVMLPTLQRDNDTSDDGVFSEVYRYNENDVVLGSDILVNGEIVDTTTALYICD